MKVLSRNKNKIIIEHNNFRTIVTPEFFNYYGNGETTIDDLIESGIPVSVNWSDFIDLPSPLPYKIEQLLHQYNIHSIDDLLKNTQQANAAIFKAIDLTASKLYKTVQRDRGG